MRTASETPNLSTAYRRTVEDVLAALATDAEEGLTEDEARARLERHGRNELVTEKAVPGWRRFLAQFRDVLVILLLVATGVSAGLWAFEGSAAMPYEAIAILAVVLLNATMGFIQESRAEAAVAALRSMSAADAAVIRGGERRSVPATDIVPGDIILVEEGDTIPADARLIESIGLQTAEAALTGESLPITKDTTLISEEVPLGDRENMIFSGTSVTYGHGKAIVTATGMRTETGRIAGLLQQTPDEPTPLQRELDRTGKVLGGVVVGIAVVMIATIIVVEDVRGAAALIDVLILGVALAVVLFYVIPFVIPSYLVSQFATVLVFAIAIVGINLVTGFGGAITLGHAAFVALGSLIGLGGVGIGIALGVAGSLLVQDGYAWLERTFSIDLMNQYFVTYLPSELRVGDVVRVGGVALALSIASTLYPALRAGALRPAEVLRHE